MPLADVILTAAFLIFGIGSQAQCECRSDWNIDPWASVLWGPSCPDGSPQPTMPGALRLLSERSVLPVKDEAELKTLLSAEWLGPRCGAGDAWAVQVLDVKAGKWKAYTQTRLQRVMRVEVERKEYTGELSVEKEP